MHWKTKLAAVLMTLLCLGAQHTLAQQQSPTPGWCGKFDVMTRNMYPGTDFGEIFAAQDTPTLLAEVAEAFADVQASDVQSRIEPSRTKSGPPSPTSSAYRRSPSGRPAPSTRRRHRPTLWFTTTCNCCSTS